MKMSLGGAAIIDYRNNLWLAPRWGFTTKAEAQKEKTRLERFDKKYNRDSVYAIIKRKILHGEGKGKQVYVVIGRGK